MKRIMFDIDGVLANFTLAFTTLANEMFGSPIVDTGEETTWNHLLVNKLLTGEQVGKVWEALKEEPNWWTELGPLVDQETLTRIANLTDTNEVYFVTSRVSYHNVKEQTEWWLRKQGWMTNPTVVVTKNKGEFAKTVYAGYSIEDKPENAWMIHWLTGGKCKSYLLDRPANRIPEGIVLGSQDVIRVDTVEEYLDIVEG